ncbi:MAG: pantetheine-phosphate adenylyltransferase [Coriobacteriales bacterium]|jgi:pantetheine-phosphate adenylyltransferase|nr:pantetheine-phosphate adenylyltransferase [Coriobacteriales bacterium]
MKTALVPGTFDPVTAGHIDVIERSALIFDNIVVGVAASANKGAGPMFSIEERVAFIQDAIGHVPNARVQAFDTMLVDFAVTIGAQAIVKGLRVVTDFESEFQQASINYHINPGLETVFIMATPENMYLSSSMIKQISSLHGDVSDWVTPMVEQALRQRFASPTDAD